MRTKKITMAEYCPRPIMYNKVTEIQRIVQLEDMINHANDPLPEIPKEMKYPEHNIMRPASLHAFIKSILP